MTIAIQIANFSCGSVGSGRYIVVISPEKFRNGKSGPTPSPTTQSWIAVLQPIRAVLLLIVVFGEFLRRLDQFVGRFLRRATGSGFVRLFGIVLATATFLSVVLASYQVLQEISDRTDERRRERWEVIRQLRVDAASPVLDPETRGSALTHLVRLTGSIRHLVISCEKTGVVLDGECTRQPELTFVQFAPSIERNPTIVALVFDEVAKWLVGAPTAPDCGQMMRFGTPGIYENEACYFGSWKSDDTLTDVFDLGGRARVSYDTWNAEFSNVHFHLLNADNAVLNGMTLRNSRFEWSDFHNAVIGTELDETDMRGMRFEKTDLSHAGLQGYLDGLSVHDSNLTGTGIRFVVDSSKEKPSYSLTGSWAWADYPPIVYADRANITREALAQIQLCDPRYRESWETAKNDGIPAWRATFSDNRGNDFPSLNLDKIPEGRHNEGVCPALSLEAAEREFPEAYRRVFDFQPS
ncbi:pentapeptide repeat-containing protein [Nitratireductor mangrovi]|uniref:Pentapeptide repeat-containing protein n=1 Tax=Nitratireductor mangrovi TaxID=2599600 RepID=A0A5B8KU33_9HYPH|nr:pentapeptide repeat-containing protein [Nitratireductor mangrovi]QDY99082.1 pentapeptide repeat-containing protein [Nitratireductor mangrovi]